MRRHPVVIEWATADDCFQSANILALILDLQSRCETLSKLYLPNQSFTSNWSCQNVQNMTGVSESFPKIDILNNIPLSKFFPLYLCHVFVMSFPCPLPRWPAQSLADASSPPPGSDSWKMLVLGQNLDSRLDVGATCRWSVPCRSFELHSSKRSSPLSPSQSSCTLAWCPRRQSGRRDHDARRLLWQSDGRRDSCCRWFVWNPSLSLDLLWSAQCPSSP